MGEFKKATRELKDAINLDGEVDDVKETFQDLKYDFDAATAKEKTELPGVYGESADMPAKSAEEDKVQTPAENDGPVDPEKAAAKAKGLEEDGRMSVV